MSTNSTGEPGRLVSPFLAAWSSIASGGIGLVAYGALLAFLRQRDSAPELSEHLLRLHDGGVVLQFLLLIPVSARLSQLSQRDPARLGRALEIAGIAALLLVVFLLILAFPKIVWDVLYMFPEGLFGLWLMIVMWRTRGVLPYWLNGFGGLVGFGLILVGLFPVGYGFLIDPTVLRIPIGNMEASVAEFTPLNAVLHQILLIGSWLGVATLPVWSSLLGWRLLRGRKGRTDV